MEENLEKKFEKCVTSQGVKVSGNGIIIDLLSKIGSSLEKIEKKLSGVSAKNEYVSGPKQETNGPSQGQIRFLKDLGCNDEEISRMSLKEAGLRIEELKEERDKKRGN